MLKFDVIGGGYSGQCHGLYFIGSFDGTTFIDEGNDICNLWSDTGMDFYASQDWNHIPPEDGRKIWIGWMNNWKYAEHTPTLPSRGAMTVPREVKLVRRKEGLRLSQKPIKELRALRVERFEFSDRLVRAEEDNLLENIKGSRLEISCRLKDVQAKQFGFKIRIGDGEKTVIGFDRRNSKIYIDRSKSGKVEFHEDFGHKQECSFYEYSADVDMQILIDAFSVEVFVGNGSICMTDLIFPAEDSQGVEFFVEEGSVYITQLTVFKLKN